VFAEVHWMEGTHPCPPELEVKSWVTQNAILASLSAADLGALAPHFQLVDLPRDHRLERRGRAAEHVYFLDGGVACTLAEEGGGHGVEVGMIGRDGFVGMAAVLGATHSPYDVQMLAQGAARRILATALRGMMNDHPNLRRAVMAYVHRFLLQAMREAQVNARATLDARLSRWLLMMHDRVDGDELYLTHDRLATMLGVRRAGVSVALKKLERSGVIILHRGSIVVRDRKNLEDSSCDAYGALDRQTLEARVGP
jgi:CRP-like cAMP-binding protein